MSSRSGAVRIGILTFVVAIALTSVFQLANLAFFPAAIILVVIIGVGILFDIVGTAVTSVDERSLHAMAADRVPGARWAIYLARRADRVANFCNDVVGDICGTTSGAAAAAIVVFLAAGEDMNGDLLGILMVGLVAALTVGGKAAGKRIAVSQSEHIMLMAGRAILAFDEGLGLKLLDRLNRSAKNRKKSERQKRDTRPRQSGTKR